MVVKTINGMRIHEPPYTALPLADNPVRVLDVLARRAPLH
jgi:hypothetical protein